MDFVAIRTYSTFLLLFPGTNLSTISRRRYITLFSLIIAGEAVFFLPFILPRVFRPTMLGFFEMSNTQLGLAFSAYGVVAMVSYVLGGPLADRYPARRLMSYALWLTSLGGVLITFSHSMAVMVAVYAFWGFTTIFLFWAAMIRATREWGGEMFQGSAFGWLEGGRGAVGALLGTISWVVFVRLSVEVEPGVISHRSLHPYQVLLLVTSGLSCAAGLLVWYNVPDNKEKLTADPHSIVLKKIMQLLRLPTIWLLSVIIICAYCGFKVTDNLSLYAREVLGFSEVKAAATGTLLLWLRSIVGITMGMVADRLLKGRLIMYLFAVTCVGAILLALGLLERNLGLLLVNMASMVIGIYGIRSLYFAVLREARIPLLLTGTAVGLVSFMGYTPDIFMGPLMGYLLDRYPGATGHHYVFMVTAGFAFTGLLATVLFERFSRQQSPGTA